MIDDDRVLATRTISGIGDLTVRPFDVVRHAPIAHHWLTSDHARFWGMTDQDAAATHRYFQAIADSSTHEAWFGTRDGEPAFLVETYAPAADAVGAHYAVADGDRGFHVLVAPPVTPRHGFTWAVFALIVDTLFERPSIDRLVVEPDIDNAGIHVLNARAGFVRERRIDMGDKTAWLATCSRARHAAAMTDLAADHARLAARDAPTRDNETENTR